MNKFARIYTYAVLGIYVAALVKTILDSRKLESTTSAKKDIAATHYASRIVSQRIDAGHYNKHYSNKDAALQAVDSDFKFYRIAYLEE